LIRQFITLVAVVALSSAFGQAPAKPVVILFVGNSFFHGAFEPVLSYNAASVTDENANAPAGDPRGGAGRKPYGGIPAIFKTLTTEVGLDYDVHSELISGRSLEFHYRNALPIINQSKWDVVVMHDYSTGPVPAARGGNPELFTRYADLLEQSIHGANGAAEVYLYETWSRADLTYPATGPYHGAPIEAMASDLHDAYDRERAHKGHILGVAPAGDAWMRAIHEGVAVADPHRSEAGKIDLWGADDYHPSIYGAYLNALVLLEEITGKDPRQLGAHERAAAALGITPEVALSLQRIAHEQVRTT
jgi:hypothetical protein